MISEYFNLYLEFFSDLYLDYGKGLGWLFMLLGYGDLFYMFHLVTKLHEGDKKKEKVVKIKIYCLVVINIIVIITGLSVLRNFNDHLSRRVDEGRLPIWYNKK